MDIRDDMYIHVAICAYGCINMLRHIRHYMCACMGRRGRRHESGRVHIRVYTCGYVPQPSLCSLEESGLARVTRPGWPGQGGLARVAWGPGGGDLEGPILGGPGESISTTYLQANVTSVGYKTSNETSNKTNNCVGPKGKG